MEDHGALSNRAWLPGHIGGDADSAPYFRPFYGAVGPEAEKSVTQGYPRDGARGRPCRQNPRDSQRVQAPAPLHEALTAEPSSTDRF